MCGLMYKTIKISDINDLITLNVTFTALSHTRLPRYSTGGKQGWRKTKNLLQRFCLLHNVKKYQNDRYFCANLVPLLEKLKRRQLNAKKLTVQMNVRFHHQKYNQQPQQLERHIYGPVKNLTDYIQHSWQTRLA